MPKVLLNSAIRSLFLSKVLLNTDIVSKVMDDSGISPGHGKVALSLATTSKSWRKTKTAFWIKPMMNVGTDSHLTMPLNKVDCACL